MSKKIECRLPDQLYADLKAKCHDNKITVTDAVISNITGWLYNDNGSCHDKAECAKTRGLDKMAKCHDKPKSEIVPVSVHSETIYEPDPVKPVKTPKVSSKAAPIVNGLLSGIKRAPTVQHHPQCSCGMCKPGKAG